MIVVRAEVQLQRAMPPLSVIGWKTPKSYRANYLAVRVKVQCVEAGRGGSFGCEQARGG